MNREHELNLGYYEPASIGMLLDLFPQSLNGDREDDGYGPVLLPSGMCVASVLPSGFAGNFTLRTAFLSSPDDRGSSNLVAYRGLFRKDGSRASSEGGEASLGLVTSSVDHPYEDDPARLLSVEQGDPRLLTFILRGLEKRAATDDPIRSDNAAGRLRAVLQTNPFPDNPALHGALQQLLLLPKRRPSTGRIEPHGRA